VDISVAKGGHGRRCGARTRAKGCLAPRKRTAVVSFHAALADLQNSHNLYSSVTYTAGGLSFTSTFARLGVHLQGWGVLEEGKGGD